MPLSLSRGAALFAAAAAALTFASVADATTVYDAPLVITSSSPTQLGRLSRSIPPSDWSSLKAFPGIVNPSTTYHYTTLDIDLAALETGYVFSPYIEITFNSTATTTFLSAYEGSYNPADLSQNYFGDTGQSTYFSGTDVSSMQLVQPANQHLILVMNESVTNGGLNMPGNVIIDAYSDTQYTDLAPVPEASTWAMLAGGLAVVGGLARRRRPVNAAPALPAAV